MTLLKCLEENLAWKKVDIDFASIVAEEIIRRRSGRRLCIWKLSNKKFMKRQELEKKNTERKNVTLFFLSEEKCYTPV